MFVLFRLELELLDATKLRLGHLLMILTKQKIQMLERCHLSTLYLVPQLLAHPAPYL